MTSPGQLYDALFSFESRFRAGAYPIHKRLCFDDRKTDDIYNWIIKNSDVPENGVIMDAGCGVGFGTLRLAACSNSAVVGIGVSDAEIKRATRNVEDAGHADRVTIRHESYDNLDEGAFDMIIAVESLKHSFDVKRSIQSLVNALKPGGRMVIVEDLFSGPQQHPSARQLGEDWALTRNYSESDYVDALNSGRTVITDLTPYVNISGRFSIKAGLLGVQALLMTVPSNHSLALRAFRGGLHLQRLYSEGLMHYKAIEITKDAAVGI